MKLIKGFRITKLDNIIAGVLFVAVIATPAYITIPNTQFAAIIVLAMLLVVACWRLSYLRSKRNEKTAS